LQRWHKTRLSHPPERATRATGSDDAGSYSNFYETQRAFYQSRDTAKDEREEGIYEIFKRWEYIQQFRADRNGVLPSRHMS